MENEARDKPKHLAINIEAECKELYFMYSMWQNNCKEFA